jgi:hypothetical protein
MKTRTDRRLLLLAALVLAPIAARAQVAEIYATLTIPHASNVQTGAVYSAATGMYTNQYTSFTAAGIGGGVTLNFLPLPVVKLGLDLRGSTKPGTVGVDKVLSGLKLTIKPPAIKMKPYVEAAAGYLGTRTVNVSSNPLGAGTVGGTFENKYAVYEILGGIDYPLVHFVDFRVIEIGGGHSLLDGSQGASLFTVSTGLVLHF